MADQTPSLHIDDDWKRQAQEEKRKLAEAEAAKKSQASAGAGVATAPDPSAGRGPARGPAGRGARETPQANFASLVQTLMTQALFYLGELGTRTGQTMVDLDMAKLQIDLLGVLEEKTASNLTEEERSLLDSALYETRMRFVAVAREYAEINPR